MFRISFRSKYIKNSSAFLKKYFFCWPVLWRLTLDRRKTKINQLQSGCCRARLILMWFNVEQQNHNLIEYPIMGWCHCFQWIQTSKVTHLMAKHFSLCCLTRCDLKSWSWTLNLTPTTMWKKNPQTSVICTCYLVSQSIKY